MTVWTTIYLICTIPLKNDKEIKDTIRHLTFNYMHGNCNVNCERDDDLNLN